jgi:transposase
MRGSTTRQVTFLAVTPDELIPDDHPIRLVKPFVDEALSALSPLFDEMYAADGRPSIPPEHLLKASLLMALTRSAASASSASGSATTSSSSGFSI